jgi:SAM-dependent methyltransferase
MDDGSGVKAAEASNARSTAHDATTDAIRHSYKAFPYDSRPCPTSTPARIATVARLLGVEAPDPARARVLEIACSDGGNLVPMACATPGGRFVGIDLASEAVEVARGMARDLGVGNLTLIDGDLRNLPSDLGPFDYIVAHGFHSWVPPEVRVAMFDTMRTNLAPDGIAFVSHNVMPGCALRGIPWSAVRPQVMDIEDPARRIGEARAVAARMATTMSRLPGMAVAVAEEFRDLAERQDIVLVHDDLASLNQPVYLRDIAAEAASHGLEWLADADPSRHVAYAYDEPMNRWLASLDRMAREHVVDHLRLRRYRESLFVHQGRPPGAPMSPERLGAMHVAAANSTVERHASLPAPPAAGDRSGPAVQRRLLDRLVRLHPSSAPVAEVVGWIAGDAAPGSPLADPPQARQLLLSACATGVFVPLGWPVDANRVAGERPCVFAPARWQAERHEYVVNLRHDGVVFTDAVQRRLLPLLDGTRTRAELSQALARIAADLGKPARPLGEHLAHFTSIGLVER